MSVPGPGPCATIGTVVSARRTPVALPVIVVGLAVAAAFGSGATGTAGPRTESGTFATVPPDTGPDGGPAGSDVDGSADAVEDPSGATSVTAPTDDTVPDDEPVVTALGPGILPGIDWPVFDDLIAPPLIDQGALAVSIAVSKDGRLVHEAAYGIADPAYRWVAVRRYMGIFHEVQPAARALQCLDCHREGGRMDWKALGYARDPLLAAIE